jgi:succinyldiaminopimelate transaminase
MNKRLLSLKPYPKTRLDAKKAELAARGVRLFDFGTGDPGDVTPEFIRRALIDAVPEVSEYASYVGTDELRSAAADYMQRRYGVELDPGTEVLATAGSKEAVFHMPMILVENGSERDTVVYGLPGYSVFEISSYFAEARAHPVVLTAEDRYLLTPELVGDEVLARTALVFLNYPHNPTGQEMPPEGYASWVAAQREHGFVIVSDEVYADVYFGDPPRSLLEFGRQGCLAMHSLSKRSGMTGYQSGFLAGDPEVIATLRRFRAAMGVSSPAFIQAAAAAAWREPRHVEERLAVFAEKRNALLEVLRARGVDVYPASAGLFLWVAVPEGTTDVEYAERLLERGIVVSPGSHFGEGQERFVRLALVPSADECRAVADHWPE